MPAAAHVLRAGPAVPRRRRRPTAPAGRRRAARHRGRARASASSRRGCSGTVTIREENAAAALEVMSRFAVDPRWLVYLPPTMSPRRRRARGRAAGAPGRGVRVLPRAGRRRGGVRGEAHGLARGRGRLPRRRGGARALRRGDGATGASTRAPGGPFFADAGRERGCSTASAPRDAAPACGSELETDWVLLDGELMPWSAKAQELLRRQYAPVGAAARARAGGRARRRSSAAAGTAGSTSAALRGAATRPRPTTPTRFVEAYRRYCWPVDGRSTTCASRRSTCSPPRAARTPSATTRWHMEQLADARGGRPGLLAARPTRGSSTSPTRERRRRGDRVVGGR